MGLNALKIRAASRELELVSYEFDSVLRSYSSRLQVLNAALAVNKEQQQQVEAQHNSLATDPDSTHAETAQQQQHAAELLDQLRLLSGQSILLQRQVVRVERLRAKAEQLAADCAKHRELSELPPAAAAAAAAADAMRDDGADGEDDACSDCSDEEVEDDAVLQATAAGEGAHRVPTGADGNVPGPGTARDTAAAAGSGTQPGGDFAAAAQGTQAGSDVADPMVGSRANFTVSALASCYNCDCFENKSSCLQ